MDTATEKRLRAVKQRISSAVYEEEKTGKATELELLCILAQVIGSNIALREPYVRDPKLIIPSELALKIVDKNMEFGNSESHDGTKSWKDIDLGNLEYWREMKSPKNRNIKIR